MVAAPQKRRLNLVMHDFEPGWDTYVERQGYAMEADAALDEVKGGDYAAILIIGGRAPEYLRRSAKLIGLVREFDAKKKWIFSICHGIQVLIAAGVTKGRTLTCYEHVRFELELGVAGRTHRHGAELGLPPRVLPRDLRRSEG